jgi:hypothetical protein
MAPPILVSISDMTNSLSVARQIESAQNSLADISPYKKLFILFNGPRLHYLNWSWNGEALLSPAKLLEIYTR